TTLSGSVTILANHTSADIVLPVLNDAIVEGTETEIGRASCRGREELEVAVGLRGESATASITDDDSATVSIAKINDGAETNTPTDGLFRVSLSQFFSKHKTANDLPK